MEDPVNQAGKKKPAFAFWERQRKDSASSLTNTAAAAAPPPPPPPPAVSSTTSPSTARRINALERGTSTSPSPSPRRPGALQQQQQQQQQQQAESTSKPGLSGVQRLIQQYSQTGSAAASSSSSSSSSLNRSLSGRRTNATFPPSNRSASSSATLASGPAEEPSRTDALADSPATQQAQTHLQPQSARPSIASSLARQPSTGSSSVNSASRSTHSSATPTSRLSIDAVANNAEPPSTSTSASAVTSTSQHSEDRQSDSTKEMDAEKARRRRRLVQEQLRKRNSKRRSAGAIDMTDSPVLSGEEEAGIDDLNTGSAAEPIVATVTDNPAPSALPNQVRGRPTHTRTTSASSRRANLISETDQNRTLTTGNNGDKQSEAFHDAQSDPITPSKPAANAKASVRGDQQARPPSFEDTRPWLEFSPLLPASELLDSPGRPPAPSFALLQNQSASSDMSASPSQSSVATDPNAANSMRPSPSRSNSASLLSSDSPKSPTGLGLSTPPGYPPAASYLSIHSPTHASHPRARRTTKLPPLRPSPQAPLPPPPSIASSTASSSASSRGAVAAPSSVSAGSTRAPPGSSIRTPTSLQDKVDTISGQSLRSRSYNLEQEVASADQQLRQMSLQNPATTSDAKPPMTSAPGDGTRPAAPPASTLAVPMIRQRSDSLQRRDREALDVADPALRSSRISPPNSMPPVAGAAASSRTDLSSSRTGPTTGRPRGFTVGAVPGLSQPVRNSAPAQTPVKSRPRSLLSNEIFPLDLAEPRYKSKTARQESDNARNTYSMDLDRRVPYSNIDGSNRGISFIEERNSLSSNSGERMATESSDRRPSVGTRSRSGSSASLLQQVNSQPKSHASFVIAVVGHAHSGKSTVIKKGLRQFGLSKPHVLSEKVTSHSTVCVVDQEQRTIEVLEVDASVLLNGPSKRFAWPKFLPHMDAVILCYDASEIASFRGMSELLENFSVANLSTVMLACKSEVHPKAVDPYYASDMACIYNVGLAECTVQSEEGKKRMRDCFSYLVKEVAKARSGRARRGPASTVPPASAAMASQRSLSPGAPVMQSRVASNTSQASSQNSLPRSVPEPISTSGDAVSAQFGDQLPSPAAPVDLLRVRGYSNASLSGGRAGNGSSTDAVEHPVHATVGLDMKTDARPGATGVTPRKMSIATVASGHSDAPSFQSDDGDGVLHESLHRAQIGLQNARSSGGYVSIDELWDKLFHAAISRTDERFVTMFMVFFRGFATPMELLKQMMARFEMLTAEDVADGLVHRFALIRLANMLGDWVLDYPGDLSHPETHALLVRYHRQLLRHPDTVHTASQIHAAVDATAYAPDLDALWSKTVNTDQTRQKGIAAAMAAIANAQQNGAEAEVEGAGLLPASHSSGSASGIMPSSGNTSHDFDGVQGHSGEALDEHERTGSESSLPLRPYDMGDGGRSRSASDLTSSSVEAADALYRDGKQGASLAPPSGASGSASGSANGTLGNSSVTSSTANLGSGGETVASGNLRTMNQKAALRSISNVLMEVDDEVIASELTRLEWNFFTAIQPRDLLRHILVPHDKRDGPVSRSISHFNYISNWVCSMILAQSKTKHRARMLEKFFNIASILRHDNNYGSLNSVLGGLSKTAVHRLRQTRELLKGKAVNKAYQSLVRLMSNERSSAAYRLALENSDGPTIPYVGVHLQDIISISDGNPSKRADGMIHWRKFSLMDEAVMAVVKCQLYDRGFKVNSAVERLIVDVPIMDDEALYERSLLVEPRTGAGGGGGAGSKIKDLKTFLSNQAGGSAGIGGGV
ncbi:related to aimless RasGEF (aleA) [Sporisorium scitamineum]|uniref:Related to aimless RasGEF (AleA) n=1 Tax=Sporisorium scitamineum TaxID=49012 RepID=A0A127ZBP5_9BASI|nr:related to aimless RasGEF (aleA) [Sporisorium scitamineum]